LEKQKQKKQVSMKLIATLAPAQAEIEAGVVAMADQKSHLIKVGQQFVASAISDWDSTIESLLAREPVKNWFVCQKPLCGYQSVNRLNVVSHIQAKHLENFPGFKCVLCDNLCPTLNAFARHMQRLHK
jgi:hypothetical protein